MDTRKQIKRTLRRSLVRCRRWNRRSTAPEKAVWAFMVLEVVVFVAGVCMAPMGRLVPVGSSVREALETLEATPSGRRLVRDVRKASRGDFIYLSLGETERDRLYDYLGREVRGVTRAVTLYDGRRYRVRHVAVITNRDVTGADVGEIAKSLAFELENVLQIYRRPWSTDGMDSPMAAVTQARVSREMRIR